MMMKFNDILSSGILAACCLTFASTSCTGLFPDYNTNPNQVTAEQMEINNYRTGAKVVALQNLVVPVQEHLYQFVESLCGGPYAGYIGSTKIWTGSFEYYNPENHWRKAPFGDMMTEAYAPYRGIVNGTEDAVANAFAKLFRVAIMHRMTDSYGPIPYTDAVANESLYVRYDSQEKVYDALFGELDEAIALFKANSHVPASSWRTYDKVYYGDMSSWIRYANSLKLRMAMRLSYVKPELSKAKAAEAIADGVIETNAGNAQMHANENRTTLIYNDWKDSRVGADILCYMNGYEDPRMEKMFLRNTLSAKEEDQVYAGVRIGTLVESAENSQKGYSNLVVKASDPYLWMNAAEVSFLKAEYELRWGDPARARELYENGIRLSFEERGASGAEDYILDSKKMPAPYVDPLGKYSVTARQSEIKIAWEDAGNLADGLVAEDSAEERNLERIITQKWIAIFPLGNEAWAEYRRTGYPHLLPGVEDKSGGSVDLNLHARRLVYPVEEYQMNMTFLQEAIGILDGENPDGTFKGDKFGTRVWWDVKELKR